MGDFVRLAARTLHAIRPCQFFKVLSAFGVRIVRPREGEKVHIHDDYSKETKADRSADREGHRTAVAETDCEAVASSGAGVRKAAPTKEERLIPFAMQPIYMGTYLVSSE